MMSGNGGHKGVLVLAEAGQDAHHAVLQQRARHAVRGHHALRVLHVGVHARAVEHVLPRVQLFHGLGERLGLVPGRRLFKHTSYNNITWNTVSIGTFFSAIPLFLRL